jgi:endonuclease YncB( thermonuclease family)
MTALGKALAAMTIVAMTLTAAPANAARVDYVVDGDTIRLKSGAYVRLIGIDTPEVGECGYGAAKRKLDRMIGSTVRLPNPSSVQDEDRYGRLLRYVMDGDRDTGLVLLRQGLAKARYDGLDGYDWHPRQSRYRAADANNRDVC